MHTSKDRHNSFVDSLDLPLLHDITRKEGCHEKQDEDEDGHCRVHLLLGRVIGCCCMLLVFANALCACRGGFAYPQDLLHLSLETVTLALDRRSQIGARTGCTYLQAPPGSQQSPRRAWRGCGGVLYRGTEDFELGARCRLDLGV